MKKTFLVLIIIFSIFIIYKNIDMTRKSNFVDENTNRILLYETDLLIKENKTEYRIKLVGKTIEEVNSILIMNKKTNQLIQELACTYNIGPIQDSYGLSIKDFNFDGNLDIGIQEKGGAGANTRFSYWLWNSKKSKFVFNEDLSELTAITLYPQDKIIISENSCCAGTSYIESAFQFKEENLIMVKKLDREWDESSMTFVYKFYKIHKGKEKLIYKTSGSNNQTESSGYEHFIKDRVWTESDFN